MAVSLSTRFDVRTFIITVVIGLLLFIVIVTWRYNSCNDDEFVESTVDKCIAEAQTGDIVGVAYSSKRARLVRVFTGSMWIHLGIVVRTYKGEAWVVEAARYNPTTKGILSSPLKEWLEHNEGHSIAWRRHVGSSIRSSRVRRVLQRTQYADINLYVVDWLKTMYKTPYSSANGDVVSRDKYYCSEFVALMLQELGIMDKVHDPSGYKPWELLYGSNLPLLGYHDYDEPTIL